MTEQYAQRIIGLTRPQAKFGGYAHTDDFLDLEAEIGKGFFYVSLYDEHINANLIETPSGIILLDNTYLSSFAYNLALAWRYEHQQGHLESGKINPLIKHNFKKFFAEQLIHSYNNTFSRAVFLETLLYEQHLMIPVFEAAGNDPAWCGIGDGMATNMGNLVLFHELGHYYRKYKPEIYDEVIRQNAATVKPLLDFMDRTYNEAFKEEVRCDLLALFSRLLLDGGGLAARTFFLRSAVLGFSAFAVLWSLQKSAAATAEAQRREPDRIILRSIEKSQQEYTFSIGRDTDMIERAGLMIFLCEAIAQSNDIRLYGEDGQMPLTENILNDLLAYIPAVMEMEDSNQRAMARLMAEALHQHPEGLDYLYLHSKVFKSSRTLHL